MGKGNKTHKATAKRFSVKKSKNGIKLMNQTGGKGHFNARESGKTTRNKRRDSVANVANKQTILRSLPHA